MMQIKVLNYSHHTKNLILFFSGIGGNESLFNHLILETSTSLIFIHDYIDLNFYGDLSHWDEIYKLSNGKNTSLLAWSMGVGIANYFVKELDFLNLDTKIAINGTKQAINLQNGIPPKIFNFTLKNIDSATFYHNVLESTPSSNIKLNTTNELKQELAFIYPLLLNSPAYNDLWDLAIISKDDKIFPTSAQISSWNLSKTKTRFLSLPHFIFSAFSSWQDILDLKS